MIDPTSLHPPSSWFTQGAVDVYSSRSVAIANCHFFHNGPVGVVKTDELRGHAAGLSLGYSITADEEENLTAIVESCVFYNNSALLADSSTSEALNDRVFPGRGGGLAVLVDSVNHGYRGRYKLAAFSNNFATEFGGGAFTELCTLSSSSNHLITFQTCVFDENGSETHAGGLGIEISGNGNGTESSGVVIRDCVFRGNTAECGGGSYLLFTTGDDVILQWSLG
ncbi:hypothetical protein GBAR_LOCUS18317 [Geodia barretti]|uniref:Uncharacterized protein n=1 Tax=Geodia barretti TaxID=519541 RepID=A0AA35SP90_GEOBA|nr:hypothetical protein GBAR_LOCUS18317 [Geodia barretti]